MSIGNVYRPEGSRVPTLGKASLLAVAFVLSACGSSGRDTALDDDLVTDPDATGYPALLDYTADEGQFEPAPATKVLPPYSRLIGDVNADGLPDVAQVIRESVDKYSAVIYFATETGDYPTIDELDGQNGFVLEHVSGSINRPDDNPTWSGGPVNVGDLNGDGYDDIGVQNFSWQESEGAPEGGYGIAWGYKVLPGSPQFEARQSVLAIPSDELLVELATTTGERRIGDLNGDGFDDLLIGSRWSSNRIVYGAASLNFVKTVEQLDTELRDDDQIFCRGCNVSTAGDNDADGYDDLLVTHRTADCGYSDSVIVIYGSSDGIEAGQTFADLEAREHTRLVNEAGGRCNSGGYLAAVGDIDGDGADDLLQDYYGRYDDSQSRASVIFGHPGVRPAAVSQDELDGAKGFLLNLGSSRYIDDNQPIDAGDLFIADVDNDGFDDILFPNNTLFKGRPRDNSAVDFPVVVRLPETVSVRWDGYNRPSTTAFRIIVDGGEVSELSGETRDFTFPDYNGGLAFDLSLQALDASGEVLSTSLRRIPAYAGTEQLTGEVQGDRLIELTFNGDESIEYYSHYLVWRDGIPIGRSLNGADNYIDLTVSPGTTYQYFITPDYLVDGSLDASQLQRWPLLQRRSNSVELTTTGEKPLDVGSVVPDDPGSNLLVAPSGVRLEVYASQVAELFWISAEGVVSTDVYRDGLFLSTVDGDSYYDTFRQPGFPHRYALVATAADGSRSPLVAMGTFEESSTEISVSDDNSFVIPYSFDYNANTLAILQDTYGSGIPTQSLRLLDRQQSTPAMDPWHTVVTFQGEASEDVFSMVNSHVSALAISDAGVLLGNSVETIDFSDPNDESPFRYHFEFSIIERDADATWKTPQRLTFSDATLPITTDQRNPSVALHGTTALVGGRNDAVYVFERRPSGTWTSVQKLVSVAGQTLGEALALHGDIAVMTSSGGMQVHVFSRDSAGLWVESQILSGMTEAVSDLDLILKMTTGSIALATRNGSGNRLQIYGLDSAGVWYPQAFDVGETRINTMAIDGNTLLLGLPSENGLAERTGTVVVYRLHNSDQWIKASNLFAADGGSNFGDAVALDDNTAVVVGNSPASHQSIAYFYTLPTD